ncbi:ATP-dependent DNA ligase [Parasediminibacterium sp. JCM 36343]|uniref:ATP-dependent DNA ligase n=1 Tax=Parasediminibacterium sp. JCM 36343 TaxID=3374279 RepID=UPI00397C5266
MENEVPKTIDKELHYSEEAIVANNGFAAFATLIYILGTSTKNNVKLDALQAYFSTASDADKVWVIAIFSGRRPKRIVSSTLLQTWCVEITGLPMWLFEECYHTVGDLGETIALLLPAANSLKANTQGLDIYLQEFIILEKAEEQVKKAFIIDTWMQMGQQERFVFNKLITGGFRIGVSQKMMVNALAKTVSIPASTIAHKICGNWNPATTSYTDLLNENNAIIDHSKPYPFYLAYPVEGEVSSLGDMNEWQAEWKWDGIRGQLIKRDNQLFVWSRGEELMTDKFPEYKVFKDLLPNGVVLDGEIICLSNEPNNSHPFTALPFALLQTRIGRKNITKKQLQEAPVGFIAYDVLEYNGEDFRGKPLVERREVLEGFTIDRSPLTVNGFHLSPIIQFESWEQLAATRIQSRDIGSEGLMLKRKSSIYQVGRKVGDWWKWKIEPMVIDAVLIYAQKGHGRRSNLYTDYTFAVKDGDKLVTFAKAYSGLTDKEFNEVDAFVKNNSIEKFGPVRTVKPQLVFEIAFEGIAASNRHKSGVALRFPRMNRWRKDKKVEEINTLDDLKGILAIYK